MIKTVRGVRDILPEESPKWRFLEESAHRVFSSYGYRELRTPIFEKTELFARAVGATTDIVEKEMYTFLDRGGDSLSLRPEGTASVVRTFIENSLHRHLPWAVYYGGPMFRYERPQKGRFRQFHQMGCELFGPSGPLVDAEMMAMILRFLRIIGVNQSLTLEINSLGCTECRTPYRELLIQQLIDHRDTLCGHCQNRLQRNPLRVLDCKVEQCRGVALQAPHMKEHLCTDCKDHFQGLISHLNNLKLPFKINPLMVRGLDYYNRTAFEVTTTSLGTQNAVAAGGRYDSLVSDMGGKSTPAIGFAMGVERLVLLLEKEETIPTNKPDICLVAVGEGVRIAALEVAETLRDSGLRVGMDWMSGSMKSQMKRADRSQSLLTVIMGEEELQQQTIIVKKMADRTQCVLSWNEAAEKVRFMLDNP